MKTIILLFSLALCAGYGMAWAQPATSYGGLQANGTTAGTNGNASNSYFGDKAGKVDNGDENTFVGNESGFHNDTGIFNTFIGRASGWSNENGNHNTFMGRYSGFKNINGSENTFLGERSGSSNTTGGANTFIGNASGLSNNTGDSNTFVGAQSGQIGTTGHHNTFVGSASGLQNNGIENTFVGSGSGRNNFVGSGNVFVGYVAGYNETGSDKLYIDNSPTATPLIWGDFANNILNFNANVGIGTTTPDARLAVNGNVRCEEVKIEVVNPPDYVFEEDYDLRSLEETKAYIQKHKHLPEIPSATEMEAEGVELGEMNMLLLKKIEELTLYTITQDKTLKQQQKHIEKLIKRIEILEKQ